MKALHFGAGNIGRGFIGLLLHESGYDITFVDVNDRVINALNNQKEYTVHYADDTNSKTLVTRVGGINSKDHPELVGEAIRDTDVITTAVGPNILPLIAKTIADGLTLRFESNTSSPLTIMACENMIGATDSLIEAIRSHLDQVSLAAFEKNVYFANTAVDRIVPDQHYQDPLTVEVEPFFEWVIETRHLSKDLPHIEKAKYVESLKPYIERKLFTVNTGHAIVAYLGFAKNYETIDQAMQDTKIQYALRQALSETGELLEKKYGFDTTEHQNYIDTTIKRFENPRLSDKLIRVGRSPLRKLGPADRLVQPAKQYVEAFNETPKALAQAIASVLLYENDEDPEAVVIQDTIRNQSPEKALEILTGIGNYSLLFDKIMKAYELLKN